MKSTAFKKRRLEATSLAPTHLLSQSKKLRRDLTHREFLEGLVSTRVLHTASKILKGKRVIKEKKKNPFTLWQQARVIHLRYGTTESDEAPRLSAKQVMLVTGIRQGAQYNIISRWKARNFSIESHYYKCGRHKKLSV